MPFWAPAARLAQVLALCLPLLACATAFTPQQGETWQAMQQRYLDWNAKRDGWAQSPSGLQYHRLGRENSTGERPQSASIVSVQCEGHLVDGRLFFATAPGKPLTGPLTKLIKGWQEGLQLMHTGEVWEFVLPAALAYGDKGWHSASPDIPSIPPQTTLLFKIELLSVSKPPQSAGG